MKRVNKDLHPLSMSVEPESRWPLTIVLVSLLNVVVLIIVIYRFSVHTEISYHKLSQADYLDSQKNAVLGILAEVESDIRYLIDFTNSRELPAFPGDNCAKELENNYLRFARHKARYDQIRYLDRQGQEIVRVNWNEGNPYVVALVTLQNKRDRYYFQEAMVQRRGVIYFSPFDLNVELGKIQQPFKPMIRIGGPVFNPNGEKAGLVVVNYLGDELLERLRRVVPGVKGDNFLVNAAGYYLKGRSPDDEWGFQLPDRKNRRMDVDYPEAWRAIQANDTGTVVTKQGMFLFVTIDPVKSLEEELFSEDGKPKTIESRSLNAHWKLIAFLDRKSMLEKSDRVLYQLAIGGLILFCFILFLWGLYTRLNKTRRIYRRELRRLSQAIEQSPSTVVITDLNADIIYANSKFEETTGYTIDEVVGRNPRLLKSGQQPEEVYRQLWATLTAGGTWRGEFLNKRKNGELYWEYATISPMKDEAGLPTHYLAIKEDVTERKKAETELSKAMHMAEKANRSKSEFLANMSHEIRTPMNGIVGMTDLALNTDLTREQRSYLEMVKASSANLLNLLNDILDLSRIESGNLDLNSQPFNLLEAVESAIATVSPSAGQKNLELGFYLEAEIPWMVVGDQGRLGQVLINLLGNAIKFTAHGEVILEITLDHKTEGMVTVLFQVRDTGIGIPADKQRMIFSPFTQVDGSMTREYGGSGLGLSICSQLVGLMGGRIWVESTVGQGSTFYFTCEFGLAAEKMPDETERVSNLMGMDLLLIENRHHIREMLGKTLSGWGLKVMAMANASEAWDHLEMSRRAANGDYKYYLIGSSSTDIAGFELAERISGLRTEPPPVIILMVPPDFSPEDHGLNERFFLIRKPVLNSELQIILESASAGLVRPGVVFGMEKGGKGRLVRPDSCALEILMAEDDELNQKVVERLLALRGHRVTTVENGHDVLAILKQRTFDLILMDVRMPGLDGIETTKAIRELESDSKIHVPIIALTARAMKGDRDNCLASGMDYYLSKPLDSEEFTRIIKDVCKKVSSESEDENTTAESGGLAILEKNELLDRVDGDMELLREIVEMFFHDLPVQRDQIDKAIIAGDKSKFDWAVKNLKAAAGTFSAKAVVKVLNRMEKRDCHQDREELSEDCRSLDSEVEQLKAALRNWL